MRFRHHVFVCENRRPDDDPRGCCAAKGSEAIRAAFKDAIRKHGLKGQVRANAAGCLDACAEGPSVVVYPEGVWYSHVSPEDVPEIVERHLLNGEPVARLRNLRLERKDG
jgi:(2Fe-2S) ferredoxin